MAPIRKPLQGVRNIIRFNWHFYLYALIAIALLILCIPHTMPGLKALSYVFIIGVTGSVAVSLAVSFYVYDFTDLYSFDWLNAGESLNKTGQRHTIINIHAGFDETSSILAIKYPDARLIVCDFYDPEIHTEISVKRARAAYPAFKGTIPVSTKHLPFPDNSADSILLICNSPKLRMLFEFI